MDEKSKIIEEQLTKVPINLRRAIKKTAWEKVASDISKNNKLNEAQERSLEQETMLILYLFDNPSNLISNIIKEVGVDNVKAEILAEEIVNKILLPIQRLVGAESTPQEKGMGSDKFHTNLPEIAPEIHPVPQQVGYGTSPMIKKGKVAHDAGLEVGSKKDEVRSKDHEVSPETNISNTPKIQKPQTPAPTPPINHYAGGKDPYREPIE